jgi:hypothetical protein
MQQIIDEAISRNNSVKITYLSPKLSSDLADAIFSQLPPGVGGCHYKFGCMSAHTDLRGRDNFPLRCMMLGKAACSGGGLHYYLDCIAYEDDKLTTFIINAEDFPKVVKILDTHGKCLVERNIRTF